MLNNKKMDSEKQENQEKSENISTPKIFHQKNISNDSIEYLREHISKIEFKLQTVVLSAEFVNGLLRKKSEKIEENKAKNAENQLNIQEIEKIIMNLHNENNEQEICFNDLKKNYKIQKQEFVDLQNSIKESDENVVSTAENYINSQQILAEIKEAIEELIPQKEKLRQDIRTCFTGQAPLKTEKEQAIQQVRNVEKILSSLQSEKSEIESKLTQHKSQLRGNKLGLTTDETGRRAAAMRLQQAKTELSTVENKLAETISLAHEQSGLSQRFQNEIKEMEDENNNLKNEIRLQQDAQDSLKKDNEKYENILLALDTKIEQIQQEQTIQTQKLKKKQQETEEMIQTGELRKQQVNTYFESLKEKKTKLENEIMHYDTEIRHVRERNAELHKRSIIMKKRTQKQKTPVTSHLSRSKLFPSV